MAPKECVTSIDGQLLTNLRRIYHGWSKPRDERTVPSWSVDPQGSPEGGGNHSYPSAVSEEPDTMNGDHEIDPKHQQDIAASIQGPMGVFKYDSNFRSCAQRVGPGMWLRNVDRVVSLVGVNSS